MLLLVRHLLLLVRHLFLLAYLKVFEKVNKTVKIEIKALYAVLYAECSASKAHLGSPGR